MGGGRKSKWCRSKDEVVLGEVDPPTVGVTTNPPPGSISKPLYDDSTSTCHEVHWTVALPHREQSHHTIAAGVASAPIEVPLQPWLGSEEEETDA